MKCDELEKFDATSNADLSAGYDHRYAYDADDVDAVLAEKDKEIYELQRKLQDQCISCPVKMQEDDVVAELKEKLEDAKATAYAESVDAGMDNRRLKRALWLARADRAIMTLDYFTLKCRWFQDYMKVAPPKCDVKMIHKWAGVERKCRAKAEDYK